MIILAVDPGATTGWAWSVDGVIHSDQASANEFIDKAALWLTVSEPKNALVVCERFVISGGTVRKSRGDENWSIEQVGVLRHHCRWADVRFELQSAADAKAFAPNVRLKAFGIHRPGRDHANDAARHVLLALARFDRPTFDRLYEELVDST